MNRWMPVLLAGMLCFKAAASPVELKCGKKPPKNATRTTITLSGPRPDEGAASIYYVSNSWDGMLMYFRAADVLTTIDEMVVAAKAQTGHGSWLQLEDFGAEIRKDQPLASKTDLKKYAVGNFGYALVARDVVAELLKQGRASFGGWNYFGPYPDESGWQNYTTLVMYSLGSGFTEAQRLFCTPEGYSLFGISYYFDD